MDKRKFLNVQTGGINRCSSALNISVICSTRCATNRTVPGSIPGGVTWDFFLWFLPTKTMCPEVDKTSENEYQVFLLG